MIITMMITKDNDDNNVKEYKEEKAELILTLES